MGKINFNFNLLRLISCAVLVYLFFQFADIIDGIGGGVSVVVLISFILLLTFILKILSSELSLLTLILIGILTLNYFGFLERKGLILKAEIILIFTFCVVVTLSFLMLIFMKMITPKDEIDKNSSNIWNSLFLAIFSPVAICAVFMLIALANFSLAQEENIIRPKTFWHYTDISVFVIIVGLFVSLILLSKIKDGDLLKIINLQKYNVIKYDAEKVKRYSLLLLAILFVLGSIVEVNRGLWMLWIETNIILVLIFVILWKVYKHVFIPSKD